MNRSKRPTDNMGSGGSSGGGKGMGSTLGIVADLLGGTTAIPSQDAGMSSSDDVGGQTTAATQGVQPIGKPSVFQQLLKSPQAQAYLQQQLSAYQMQQQLANQQQLSLYNAQTVDPILKGNETTALGARAPIDVQKANAQKYGIDYNDWTTARPQALTTFGTTMEAEQAQNAAARQAGINARIKGEGYQQFARGIGANTGSGEEFTTALGAEKAQAGLQDFGATRPAMSQFATQDANNQLQQSQMLGRTMNNQANILPLQQSYAKAHLANEIAKLQNPYSTAFPMVAPAYVMPSGQLNQNPAMMPAQMTPAEKMQQQMQMLGNGGLGAGTTAQPMQMRPRGYDFNGSPIY